MHNFQKICACKRLAAILQRILCSIIKNMSKKDAVNYTRKPYLFLWGLSLQEVSCIYKGETCVACRNKRETFTLYINLFFFQKKGISSKGHACKMDATIFQGILRCIIENISRSHAKLIKWETLTWFIIRSFNQMHTLNMHFHMHWVALKKYAWLWW